MFEVQACQICFGWHTKTLTPSVCVVTGFAKLNNYALMFRNRCLRSVPYVVSYVESSLGKSFDASSNYAALTSSSLLLVAKGGHISIIC